MPLHSERMARQQSSRNGVGDGRGNRQLTRLRSDRLVLRRLRDLLRARCAELRTGESVASALKISLRTLHRQLRDGGGSLQELKNEVRRDLAMERLERSSRSIKQIAHDVGFRSEKSFMRAFKQWTATSPAEFRRRTRAPNHTQTSGKVSTNTRSAVARHAIPGESP